MQMFKDHHIMQKAMFFQFWSHFPQILSSNKLLQLQKFQEKIEPNIVTLVDTCKAQHNNPKHEH